MHTTWAQFPTGLDHPPHPTPPPFFLGTLLSEANLKIYPLFLRAIIIGAFKLYKTLWSEGVSYYTKSIKNNIIITLYTFRLNSAFTADTCFG